MPNLVYSLDGERVVSSEATASELDEARAAATLRLAESEYTIRSCWVCNPAHAHFLENRDDGFLFYCLTGCGRWYYQGVDITEDEK